MHTLKALTLQGLILSCRNFMRWFMRLAVKRCVEFSWFFVDRVLLIILLWRTIFRNLKIPKLKYLKNHLFRRYLGTSFWWSYPHKWAGRVFFLIFQGLGAFFATTELLFGPHFFHKKVNFVFFFKCDYLISI